MILYPDNSALHFKAELQSWLKIKTMLHSLQWLQRGYSESPQSCHHHRVREILSKRFLHLSSQWTIRKSDAPFKRRVTCIDWHPTLPHTLVYGSQAGDILLWKYNASEHLSSTALIEGIGYGYGSISSLKFHPTNPNCIYATSIDGTFCLKDFTGKHTVVYLDTQDYHFWWVSFDYCRDDNLLFVGDNTGKAILLSTEGKIIKEFKKLHKGKIKHAEFCPAQSNLLVTSSVDRTVKIWDTRMLKEDMDRKVMPLSSVEHESPVSSSRFDPLSGTRLLTTAQKGQLLVYDSFDNWTKPSKIIDHAHKHFQHLTDITATWHPLYDNVCVVGRYPRNETDERIRGVDLIDLDSGQKAGHIYSPHVTGILSVNKFDSTGEFLASGEGCRVMLWKLPSGSDCARRREGDSEETSTSVPGLSGEPSGDTIRRKRKREPREAADTITKKLKQKMASEIVAVTETKKKNRKK